MKALEIPGIFYECDILTGLHGTRADFAEMQVYVNEICLISGKLLHQHFS